MSKALKVHCDSKTVTENGVKEAIRELCQDINDNGNAHEIISKMFEAANEKFSFISSPSSLFESEENI